MTAASPEACCIRCGSLCARQSDAVVSHDQVKLLRADNLPQAKLTPKVLEALLRMGCAELCSASSRKQDDVSPDTLWHAVCGCLQSVITE